MDRASATKAIVASIRRVLQVERDLGVTSPALEATAFHVENTRFAHVFHGSRRAIIVMDSVDDPQKRAVGIRVSDGKDVPTELAGRFNGALQKSRLAGSIRGSYFVIRREPAWSFGVLGPTCAGQHTMP